jgi:hypothetical protein
MDRKDASGIAEAAQIYDDVVASVFSRGEAPTMATERGSSRGESRDTSEESSEKQLEQPSPPLHPINTVGHPVTEVTISRSLLLAMVDCGEEQT